MRTRNTWLAVGLAAVAVGAAVSVLKLAGESSGHEGMVEGTVWVANEGDGSLTAIDASTNAVKATLRGIEAPHNLQVAPGGADVWAVSGHGRYAARVDAQRYSLVGTAATGKEPAHGVVAHT